jgi:hypothetical protein
MREVGSKGGKEGGMQRGWWVEEKRERKRARERERATERERDRGAMPRI